MRSAVAFIFVVAASPAFAESAKQAGSDILCKEVGERVGGLKKTCYYNCGTWEGGRAENIYDRCPSWTPRWRLNHNSQFGPRVSP